MTFIFYMHFVLNSQLTLTSYTFHAVEATFSISILCPNGQYSNTVGLSLHLLCPGLSDPSSLTWRTSDGDNQRLGTSNDTTSEKSTGLRYWLFASQFSGSINSVKESAGRQLRDVNVALIAITPFETPPRLQRIFNQWATNKLLNFTASCSPRKMLQFDLRQRVVRHFLPNLFTVDYLKCVLLNCSAGIRVGTQ